ncbi:MAG TPA: AMP-binding protein, partial [Pseudonocardiaceae bacterium]|nr:AMP-binding protein [Pseudonocardiaceae bacterium]
MPVNLPRLPELVEHLLDLPPRVNVLRRAGMFDPVRPDETIRSMAAVRRFGPLAGGILASRRRNGGTFALIDEIGSLTFDQLDLRSNALARAWTRRGLGADSVIAILCRDHRGLIDAMLASAKIGARALLANTGFSGPQLVDVAARERVSALVYDQEFAELLAGTPDNIDRYLGWVDDEDTVDRRVPRIERLIAETKDAPVPPPTRQGGMTLLTSGTTGTPKGAPRHVGSPLVATHFLERVPLHRGDTVFIASPMFHATGLSQMILTLGLGSTVVVRRRFDAEATLRALAEHRCTGFVVVPTMLQRILDLGPQVLPTYDTSALRVILTAGSVLAPEVSNRALDAFGEVVYNLYGSTEVAVATIATPDELRAAPGTVGRSPRGCLVRLYDKAGQEVTEPEVTGRIFVGSELAFTGYTDGGGKEIIGGLLSSGDVGHRNADGLLFVDGRDDDMIV